MTTQKELVLKYIALHGSILPAKVAGLVFEGTMFGSETSKRCRELRASGVLYGKSDGKFERFYKCEKIEFTKDPEIIKKYVEFAEEALNGRRVIERNGNRYYLPK